MHTPRIIVTVAALFLAACGRDDGRSSLAAESDGLDAAAAADGAPVGFSDAGDLPDAGDLADAATPDVASPDATPVDPGCAPGPTVAGFRAVACGRLARARWDHEAALLPDGRVVILGGYTTGTDPGASVLDPDVEVFDPATETFEVVAQLAHPRGMHRATALADGRVLVTGGVVLDGDLGHASATTEIFDPATDTMSAGPDMILPRELHTATLLGDGRVLIAGGTTNEDPDPDSEGVASAEVFDPATSSFTLVGAMTEERHEHEAVRLHDGRVLITGGADAPSCCDDGIAEAELFDPATDTFTATSSLITARPAHRTTRLVDGRVLVTGGTVANGGANGPTPVQAAELYDPGTDTFVSTGAMATAPGWSFTATRLDSGAVLVAGGGLGDHAERFDPAAGAFAPVASRMTASRFGHSATLLGSGAVLLVGGYDLDTADLYFP